jgi:general secretion pathway protein G
MPSLPPILDYRRLPKTRRVVIALVLPVLCVSAIVAFSILANPGNAIGNWLVGRTHRTKANAALSTINITTQSLQNFEVDFDRFPTTADGLDALVADPGLPNWHPFLERFPTDPWGSPLRYRCPGVDHPDTFDLTSAGPDGVFGTSDDLTNDSL